MSDDPKKPNFMRLDIKKQQPDPSKQGEDLQPLPPPPAPGTAAASELQARATQAFSKEALEAAARAARAGGLLGDKPLPPLSAPPLAHLGPPPPLPSAFPGWGAPKPPPMPMPSTTPIPGARGGDTERMDFATSFSMTPEPAPTAKGPEQVASPAVLLQRADEAAAAIRRALSIGSELKVAIVLGSGLGGLADSLEGARHMEYAQIPHFPRSTVAGHRGRLVYGTANGVPLLAMQGRFHYYEGYALDEVTFPVRVLWRLGVKLLVLTNAAGGISEKLEAGDLMVIEDHLNLMGVNPLRGPHDDRFGARFPDMSEVYPEALRSIIKLAAPAGTNLKSGVYAALSGPSYETPAEIRMLGRLGADAVGMSTAPEAILATQLGMKVAGITRIANLAAGLVRGHKLSHQEVVECMNAIGGRFTALMTAALPGLAKAV